MPRRMFRKEPRPSLNELMATARKTLITPEHRRAQRRSFEIGQLMLDHPEFTREHAERIVDGVIAKGV